MIEVRQLTKSFAGRPAFAPFSARIADGQTLVIAGPSGCGKTTLLRLIAGLAAPNAGEVILNGVTVSTPSRLVEPHVRGVGFVFQQAALWPHLTVRENIAFGLAGLGRRERSDRVDTWLAALGLQALAERHPDTLSGGEQRRVAVARTLAPRPRHLLLDEPLVHLDPAARRTILDAILAYQHKAGADLVYVTHDAGEAAQVGGPVLHLAPPNAGATA